MKMGMMMMMMMIIIIINGLFTRLGSQRLKYSFRPT